LDKNILSVVAVLLAGFIGWVAGRISAGTKAQRRGVDRAKNK
jgi:hypothetical protein